MNKDEIVDLIQMNLFGRVGYGKCFSAPAIGTPRVTPLEDGLSRWGLPIADPEAAVLNPVCSKWGYNTLLIMKNNAITGISN